MDLYVLFEPPLCNHPWEYTPVAHKDIQVANYLSGNLTVKPMATENG